MPNHPFKGPTYNFDHVATSVPPGTIEAVADWYGKHFGFRRIVSSTVDMDRAGPDGDNGPMFRLYGETLHRVKACFLTTGNGVGFEIFEFVDPPMEVKELSLEDQYRRGGFFHIGVNVYDPEAKCAEVCEDGAKKIGVTLDGFDGYKNLYIRDPWGHVVELTSAAWEQTFANRW